jgi:hypothetical protein
MVCTAVYADKRGNISNEPLANIQVPIFSLHDNFFTFPPLFCSLLTSSSESMNLKFFQIFRIEEREREIGRDRERERERER